MLLSRCDSLISCCKVCKASSAAPGPLLRCRRCRLVRQTPSRRELFRHIRWLLSPDAVPALFSSWEVDCNRVPAWIQQEDVSRSFHCMCSCRTLPMFSQAAASMPSITQAMPTSPFHRPSRVSSSASWQAAPPRLPEPLQAGCPPLALRLCFSFASRHAVYCAPLSAQASLPSTASQACCLTLPFFIRPLACVPTSQACCLTLPFFIRPLACVPNASWQVAPPRVPELAQARLLGLALFPGPGFPFLTDGNHSVIGGRDYFLLQKGQSLQRCPGPTPALQEKPPCPSGPIQAGFVSSHRMVAVSGRGPTSPFHRPNPVSYSACWQTAPPRLPQPVQAGCSPLALRLCSSFPSCLQFAVFSALFSAQASLPSTAAQACCSVGNTCRTLGASGPGALPAAEEAAALAAASDSRFSWSLSRAAPSVCWVWHGQPRAQAGDPGGALWQGRVHGGRRI